MKTSHATSIGGVLILIGVLLAGCTPVSPGATSSPSQEGPKCKWNGKTDYMFYDTYLRVISDCAYFEDYRFNSPFISLQQFFDETKGFERELVWQSVGNTCTESTMNGPRLRITDSSDLVGGGDGFCWKLTEDVSSSYIEHELTLKVEGVRSFTGQVGAIVWHKLFHHEEFDHLTADLDCIGQYLPYNGDRQIYVCNTFVYF